MHYYEALFIAHPNLEDAGLEKLIGATKKMVTDRGGELLYDEMMGKKRLAYAVEKQRFGSYVLLQFKGDDIDHVRLNRDLELKDNILAQMVVAIDPEEVREVVEVAPPAAAAADEVPKSEAKAKPKAEDSEKASEAKDEPAAEAEKSADSDAEAKVEAEVEAEPEAEAEAEVAIEPETDAEKAEKAEPEQKAAPDPEQTTDSEEAVEAEPES